MLKACLALSLLGILFCNAQEVVKNGNFENGLSHWSSPQRSGGKIVIHSISNETKYGKKALKVIGDPSNKYNSFITFVQDLPKLQKGVTYIISAKVKANVKNTSGKKFEIKIRQANAKNVGLNYKGLDINLSKNTWQNVQIPFKVAANAASFKLYVISTKLDATDSILVDDISVKSPEENQHVNSADEIIVNGNFEKGITSWNSPQQRGGKVKVHGLSQETKYGNVCLKVVGDPNNKYKNFITLVQPVNKLSKEISYIFSAKARPAVKDANKKEFKIVIRQANAKNGGLGYTGFTLNLTEDTWRSYEMRFKPRKDAVIFTIYIISSNLDSNDAVYVDNVSLVPEVEVAKPFNPAKKVKVTTKAMSKDGFTAKIDQKTGLLSSLAINGKVIHPEAENSGVVFVQQHGKEYLLNGKNIPGANNLFKAKAEYSFKDGFFREIVTVEALKDIAEPIKLGVRHGFIQKDWKKIVSALRPIRVIPATAKTIFSFGENHKDLTLGELDLYQHTAFPMSILENDQYFLFTGSRLIDGFVTISPNVPAGYFPSIQQNPKTVKKGQVFRFELNWKLFPKKTNQLRDLWRYYCDRLETNNEELKAYIPPKYTKPRAFYRGPFGSHTYFLKYREDRLQPGTNIWFYSWHDNISERYPISGSWWSVGNSFKKKINAVELKKYVDYLQNEKKFNLIFYFRQLANLNQRGKEFPDNWYHRTPGGALHLYGGGYQVKLPPHVAKEVGYDKIPLGHYDFTNPEYREYYHKEIFKALKYYKPRALGWDMGSDIYEFITMARTYSTIQKEKLPIKITANESAGPSQTYADMILLENGILGGKSVYDYEVVKAYTTAVVCLERFNIFDYAVDNALDGKRTWLSKHGLAENKRYLDYILKRHPNLRKDKDRLSQLCQVRGSMWDLGMGASPGYLEEAKPLPKSLLQMAGDANGLLAVNKSFSLKFANGLDTYNRQSAAAWMSNKSLRLVVHNDDAKAAKITLKLAKAVFAKEGWTQQTISKAKVYSVTPEGEKIVKFNIHSSGNDLVFTGVAEPFGSLYLFADK